MNQYFEYEETLCELCNKPSQFISNSVKICPSCVRNSPNESIEISLKKHEKSRKIYGLQGRVPKSSSGIRCDLCANECIIGEGERGYCGLRKNISGKLISEVNIEKGLFHSYLDSHVTNCCASWFCPGGTGSGHPRLAVNNGPEIGYYNLAIFLYGCNFDCAFCQNFSHKNYSLQHLHSTNNLSDLTLKNQKITCWCFFGGSPEPQLPFVLKSSEQILDSKPKDRILRICFEWNGCGNPKLVNRATELSLKSGGIIKFDLKCFHESMSYALCGVSNKRAFHNFEMIYKNFYSQREEVPLLTATTLLVPGYVDEIEVEKIAEFLAKFNSKIPYSLLIFRPDFLMRDLPVTPKDQLINCYKAAKKYLEFVNIGNLNLLGGNIDHLNFNNIQFM